MTRHVAVRLVLLGAAWAAAAAAASAQSGAIVPARSEDLEDFRVELTAGAWLPDTRGSFSTSGFRVDLKSDLALERSGPQFWGKLVLKPSRRHAIVVEGIPYRLEGTSVLARDIEFAGTRYRVQDRVTSVARLDYVFGGYEYDVIHRSGGHLGLAGGVGYIDVEATARSQTFAVTGQTSARAPFPLAGVDFRLFPIAGSSLLSISGELKGMSFGDLGRYLQGAVHGGVGLGRHLTLRVGYAVLDADVHTGSGTQALHPRFQGPVFSVQVRDR